MRFPENLSPQNLSLHEELSQTPELVRSLQELTVSTRMDQLRSLLPSVRTLSKKLGMSIIPTLLLSLSACTETPNQVHIDNQQTEKIAKLEADNMDLKTKIALLTEAIIGREKADERTINILREDIKRVTEDVKNKADKYTTTRQQLDLNFMKEKISHLESKAETQQSEQQTTATKIHNVYNQLQRTAEELRDEMQEVANYNNNQHAEVRNSILRILEELPKQTEGIQEEVTFLQERLDILTSWMFENNRINDHNISFAYGQINVLYNQLHELTLALQQNTATDTSTSQEFARQLGEINETLDILEQQVLNTPIEPENSH